MSTNTTIPISWDNENDAKLFGNLFPSGLSANSLPYNKNSSFESLKTNKSFEEISNEIALESPFGKESLFYIAPLKMEDLDLVIETEKWIYTYYPSDNGTDLINEYKKHNASLEISNGDKDREVDFIIYVETNYRINLGKVLLIKMSNAMLNYYFEELLKRDNSSLLKDWSTAIFEQNKSKKEFSATIDDIEKAFEIEISYRTKKNNGFIKLTPSEIIDLGSDGLSKKIREIKITRESWDPTLNSKKYKYTSFEKQIEKARITLSTFKNNVEGYRKKLEVINNFSLNPINGKNQLLEDCIRFLKAVEIHISFLVQTLQTLKENGKQSFAFICGVINGCIEFICGILDVIFLVLKIIFSNALKEKSEFELDLLQLREGLEEFIEAWLENPNFLNEQIQKMIQNYDYSRYKDPKLSIYQVAHNTGEDLVFYIDLVISFIVVVKAITNSSKYLPIFTEWIDDVIKRSPSAANKLENTILKLAKVVYGESELSKIAINYRKTLGRASLHNGNIVIVEYLDDLGKVIYKEFTTLTETEWKALGYRKKPHAERIATDWLLDNNISKEKVTKIYSELEPCNFERHKCKEMLDNLFPNAKKEFSYDYPGVLGDELKSVRDASIAERTRDMQKLVK